MKKIIFSILIATGLFTSCSMNEEPKGSINEQTAIETPLDALRFRNGLYIQLRSITTGASIVYPSMQDDMFVGVQGNGNRLGFMSLGNILPNDTDLEGCWSGPYSIIASVNYYLPKLEAVMANPKYADKVLELQRYRGEALFIRAYAYYFLADHYCNSYNLIDPNTPASGVPIVLEYNPTGDYDLYPGRSTLAQTYSRIEEDLNSSYNDLKVFQQNGNRADVSNMVDPCAPYLGTYAVAALQARINLLKGEDFYATAITKAEEVMSNTNYELTSIADYPYLWKDDFGTELIYLPYADADQRNAVASLGANWITSKGDQADYVATSNCLDMYDALNDVRYECFFIPMDIIVNGSTVTAPCFNKYPGNQLFNSGSTNALKNLSKPFRLSEMYLIIAEASAITDPTKANKMLNDLRKNRIKGWTEMTYYGQVLLDEIRLERAREFVGEGYRISDLRRWNEGFSRHVDYTGINDIYENTKNVVLQAGVAVTYREGDYKYVWPIPTAEMETNPQMKGQQNPGY